MERRSFLRGVLAAGVAVIGAAAVNGSAAAGTYGTGRTTGDTEFWLLGTGRRALAQP